MLVATTVRLLPEVIDLSIVVTASGAGGLVAGFCAAAWNVPHERLGRVVLLGNLAGGGVGLLFLVLALALQVLS